MTEQQVHVRDPGAGDVAVAEMLGGLLRDPDALRRVADDIAGRRRRSFRWCRTCRELIPPESFQRHDGYCMGCASAYHGVVF